MTLNTTVFLNQIKSLKIDPRCESHPDFKYPAWPCFHKTTITFLHRSKIVQGLTSPATAVLLSKIDPKKIEGSEENVQEMKEHFAQYLDPKRMKEMGWQIPSLQLVVDNLFYSRR